LSSPSDDALSMDRTVEASQVVDPSENDGSSTSTFSDGTYQCESDCSFKDDPGWELHVVKSFNEPDRVLSDHVQKLAVGDKLRKCCQLTDKWVPGTIMEILPDNRWQVWLSTSKSKTITAILDYTELHNCDFMDRELLKAKLKELEAGVWKGDVQHIRADLVEALAELIGCRFQGLTQWAKLKKQGMTNKIRVTSLIRIPQTCNRKRQEHKQGWRKLLDGDIVQHIVENDGKPFSPSAVWTKIAFSTFCQMLVNGGVSEEAFVQHWLTVFQAKLCSSTLSALKLRFAECLQR